MSFFRSSVFVLSMGLLLSFNSCAKSHKNMNVCSDDVLSWKQEKHAKNMNLVGQVYEKMSDRFKADISFDEDVVDDFVCDLDALIKEEASFRTDDVSLFYLIDKKHNIGSGYVPKDLVKLTKNSSFDISRNDLSLRPEAYASLVQMAQASKAQGVTLLVSSTYRSYEYQEKLFEKWVRIDGLEEAERESARAGTSQHQLGLAVDFGSIDDSFAQTKMGEWMYENSSKYGWSLSFPQNYEDVTGYRWESWHFRYVGVNAARIQAKWFANVQQYMLEFFDEWKKITQ